MAHKTKDVIQLTRSGAIIQRNQEIGTFAHAGEDGYLIRLAAHGRTLEMKCAFYCDIRKAVQAKLASIG